eukprot:14661082-Alexandrium_andersonii.AAC.1
MPSPAWIGGAGTVDAFHCDPDEDPPRDSADPEVQIDGDEEIETANGQAVLRARCGGVGHQMPFTHMDTPFVL